MGWFDLWSRLKPESYEESCRLDDIEDDIKGLKSSLQAFVEDTEKALRKLKERVGSLEEKGEWKPRFGDRVRFRHSFFGEMEGVVMEARYPSQFQLAFRDPSSDGSLKHYIADAKDVRKEDE